MARTKALTELTVADLWKEVKDPATLWGDLTPQARRTLKLLLQNRMHEELTAYLGAERYARRAGRGGVRNGVYRRQLITTWGTIPDLEIPRSRDGGFRPAVVPRYQRRMADVDRLIRSVFLAGVSTRRVGRTLAEILGDQVSASTVSTITRTLDHAVSAWHRRPLPDQYRYLILDGLSLRVKTPDGAKRRQILVAYGMTRQGRRALIDYRFVPQESQGTWEAFLANLACRGLVGQHLALITTDGHRGLHAALALVYPTVPRQTCWVHVLRTVAQRLRVRDRERCLAARRPRCRRSGAPRLGSAPRFPLRPRARLAAHPDHQCHRAGLPRGPPPHPTDDMLYAPGQLRPDRLRGHALPEQPVGDSPSLEEKYTKLLTLPRGGQGAGRRAPNGGIPLARRGGNGEPDALVSGLRRRHDPGVRQSLRGPDRLGLPRLRLPAVGDGRATPSRGAGRRRPRTGPPGGRRPR